MKQCPFCAEQIQDAAIVCRFCQRSLTPAAAPQVPAVSPGALTAEQQKAKIRKTNLRVLQVIGGLVVLWLVMLAIISVTDPDPVTPSPRSSTPTAPPSITPSATSARANKLALLSTRGSESGGGGYHIIEGEVENISGESMKSVVAVGTWYDDKDGFITSDEALIDFNPILPGQRSPFKTMSRTNPAMSKYRVQFKQFFGGTIPTEDRRK